MSALDTLQDRSYGRFIPAQLLGSGVNRNPGKGFGSACDLPGMTPSAIRFALLS
jgi:hypothetical protein